MTVILLRCLGLELAVIVHECVERIKDKFADATPEVVIEA